MCEKNYYDDDNRRNRMKDVNLQIKRKQSISKDIVKDKEKK